ncbi:LysR family transcriptional regulator [Nocardia sp.]|uniref:LysR family transcriptional regulator n=1 Tax=Nocardia sp. TaxID=1821 RepID=UPI00262394D6|nr:LysR family transcriptional regulator [Nocardia sp.]
MDLDAVRTFAAVVDTGSFQEAAVDMSITQQGASRRVAALEKDLGVRLFDRTPRGAQLTIDGRVFLPHARELLRAEERAAASVRPGRRALRVDVVGRRLAPAGLLREFHTAHPELELDVVRHFDAGDAIDAVGSGLIDASFRAVTSSRLPAGISATPVYDEPIQLLTGPAHPLAAARTVTPADLIGHRIWMPGIVTGTEWALFYADLATEFGLTVDALGPNFGIEPLLDALADSAELATFVGEQTRLVWPASHDLRRIDLHTPTPVYPHALLYRSDNPHPALAALRAHLGTAHPVAGTWLPAWVAVPGR